MINQSKNKLTEDNNTNDIQKNFEQPKMINLNFQYQLERGLIVT